MDLIRMMSDVDWWLVGRGHEDELEDQVTGFITKHNIPNVKWFWKEFPEMAPVYRECDIGLFLTEAAEGTSLAALESLASGLITVVTPVGGLTDIVLDGINGFHIQSATPDLQTKLRWIVDNLQRPEFTEIRSLARKTAERAFSLRRWQVQWVEVVKSVVRH